MSRITTEIQRINRAKSALREAINAKGGTLSETAKIDEYPDAVRRLPSGGQTMTPIKLSGKAGTSFWGFRGLAHLTECPPIETSELQAASYLFYECSSLRALPEMSFASCTGIVGMIRLSGIVECNLSAPIVTDAREFAKDCRSLTSLTLDLPQCNDALQLAFGCSSLTSLTLSIPKCTNALSLAHACSSLTSLTLDLPECTTAKYIVYNCASLTSLTLSIPKCTDAFQSLYNCPNLREVNISGLKTSLDLSTNTKISLESVKYIVDNAQSGLSGVTLTLPRVLTDAVMEDDDILTTAVEKGLEVLFR